MIFSLVWTRSFFELLLLGHRQPSRLALASAAWPQRSQLLALGNTGPRSEVGAELSGIQRQRVSSTT